MLPRAPISKIEMVDRMQSSIRSTGSKSSSGSGERPTSGSRRGSIFDLLFLLRRGSSAQKTAQKKSECHTGGDDDQADP